MKITIKKTTKRENKSIFLSFTEYDYKQKIENSDHFREYIDNQIKLYQKLFPPEITNGYDLKYIQFSKSLGVYRKSPPKERYKQKLSK